MSEERFNHYYETKIKEYAQEHVRAGNWSKENALKNAQQQFEQLLPDGSQTENQYLLTVMKANESIGILWLYVKSTKHDTEGFIYDIELDDDQRGKGYGTLVMTKLEEFAKTKGVSRVGLHVFAHNKDALALYEKMGYEVASYNLTKRI